MTALPTGIADEAYARINCYGIGGWLEDLFRQLGQTLPPRPEPWKEYMSTRSSGLVLTLYRQPDLAPASPHDALVLAKVEGDPPGAVPMEPFINPPP